MNELEFILYVADQSKSTNFYEQLFDKKPVLDVLGMTEFLLTQNVKLGLMPENGIAKIVCPILPHPENGNGIPRCELYFKVADPLNYIERGIKLGGKNVSPLQDRDWGDKVGYISDLDGHVIAFAQKK